MFKPSALKRAIFFLSFDIVISFLSLFFAYNLRFNFQVPEQFFSGFFTVFGTLVFLKVTSLYYFKIYKIAWRFFSLKDAKTILKAHILAYGTFILIFYLFPDFFGSFPRSVIIIDLFLSFIFLGFLRILKRIIIEENNSGHLKKSMIVGVSQYSQTILKDRNEFYIDAIVDNDTSVVGSYISNIKVDSFEEIESIVTKQGIETVIITKEIDQMELRSLSTKLTNLGIQEILLYSLNKDESRFTNLSVEDLLARRPKDLDKKKVQEFIKSKVILVTGAGGSIGSEICRQCAKNDAKQLILIDHSEYNLYSISEELYDIDIVSVMKSVINKEAIESTFKLYQPDIVIHAAAYKHVPLVELNIEEGIVNNVLGTKNIIDLSIAYKVEKFILISTDKAVRPTNVMGATKRISELYAQNVVSLENVDSKNTEIVAVRFGNVLGSSGSVIPKFKAQIESKKNLTVTHPDITRYFMLISEACELVLQAGAIGKGGEIFILDMGEPIKIVDLAKKMIELSAKEGIKIEFSGLRPGEKLYEELLIDESDTKTDYESITVAKPTYYDIDTLNLDISELLECEDKLSKLKKIVPEFTHQLN